MPETSDIAFLIRELVIIVYPHYLSQIDGSNLNVLLQLLISRASNLSMLSLGKGVRNPLFWNTVEIKVAQSLTELCHLPSLTTLDFWSIKNLPSSIVTQCPSLRSLSLLDVTFAPVAHVTSPSKTDTTNVQLGDYFSRFRGTYTFAKGQSANGPILSNIESFRLALARFNNKGKSKFTKLINVTAPSLESFTFADRVNSIVKKGVDLGSLPSLRKVTIGLLSEELLSPPSFKNVLKFLNYGQPTKRQDIEIILDFDIHQDRLTDIVSDEVDGLSLLRDAFSYRKHPCLRKVLLQTSFILYPTPPDSLLSLEIPAIQHNIQTRITSLVNLSPPSTSESDYAD